MNAIEFHTIYKEHLAKKARDVKKIVATDLNNEKWFQGEMLLAFSDKTINFKVVSSELYNSGALDEIDQDKWDEFVGKKDIIRSECMETCRLQTVFSAC